MQKCLVYLPFRLSTCFKRSDVL